MFYLQDTKWDLEKGLNTYFKATENKSSKVVACFDLQSLDEDGNLHNLESATKKQKSYATKLEEEKPNAPAGSSSVAKSAESATEMRKNGGKHFKILSWNIDGLDNGSREARTIGVVEKIKKEEPDVVMLQEVIETTENILRTNLSNQYELFSGKLYGDYYTMILVRNKTCVCSGKNVINFENSTMGRNLLIVKLNYMKLVDVCAMTSHLESTGDFTKQRVDQLRRCIKEVQNQDENCLVFFGGDLNLRDQDLAAIGGLPKNISDVWEATGERKECKFTWDLTRNTNLTWNQKFKPRCRFDRMFFRPNVKESSKTNNDKHYTLMPVYFELEGLEKLKSCGRFCSDHWAIQAYCQIETM